MRYSFETVCIIIDLLYHSAAAHCWLCIYLFLVKVHAIASYSHSEVYLRLSIGSKYEPRCLPMLVLRDCYVASILNVRGYDIAGCAQRYLLQDQRVYLTGHGRRLFFWKGGPGIWGKLAGPGFEPTALRCAGFAARRIWPALSSVISWQGPVQSLTTMTAAVAHHAQDTLEAIEAVVDGPSVTTSQPIPDKISAYYSLVFPNFTYYLQTLNVTIGRRCIPTNTASSSEVPQVDVDLGPLKSVSRLHARIEYDEEEERFVLVVVGRNGAWVDGVWSGSGSRVPLGDR